MDRYEIFGLNLYLKLYMDKDLNYGEIRMNSSCFYLIILPFVNNQCCKPKIIRNNK